MNKHMLEPGNTKKGVKNLLAETKGPTHSKKLRTVDVKKRTFTSNIILTQEDN